jgi:uncharacterized protein
MKITFALVLVLALAFGVQAQTASPAQAASSAPATPPANLSSEQSVNEMLKLMQLENLLKSALKQMNEGMEKGMEASMSKATSGRELTPAQKAEVEDFRKKFKTTMAEELSIDKITSIYAQTYRQTFTQDEVNGVIAFYKSPAGRAVTEKNPDVMRKAAGLTEARITVMTQKLDRMQFDFFSKFAPTPVPDPSASPAPKK